MSLVKKVPLCQQISNMNLKICKKIYSNINFGAVISISIIIADFVFNTII